QHSRFMPLPPLPELPPGQPIPNSLLPRIHQGTVEWFEARRNSLTASNCALWLGLKKGSAAKKLAACGMVVHVEAGCTDLQHAFATLMAATGNQELPPAQPRSAFASCAMKIGSIKEDDVLLTYAQHMDAVR